MSNKPLLPRPCLVCFEWFVPDFNPLTKLCSGRCRELRTAYYYDKKRPKNLQEAELFPQIQQLLDFGFVTLQYEKTVPRTLRSWKWMVLTDKGKKGLGRA